jgi:hypothetical protein
MNEPYTDSPTLLDKPQNASESVTYDDIVNSYSPWVIDALVRRYYWNFYPELYYKKFYCDIFEV